MTASLPKAILNITIDLELDPTRLGLSAQRSLDDVTGRLLNLLGKYRMPATCGVADPAVSAATERIMDMQAGHEIAIVGDATWVGREAGRSRFSRELARRVVRGRNAGLGISTLVLKTVDLDDDCDLAIKQGITAVRHPARAESRPVQPFQPDTLRFGLWSFPVSSSLPGTSRWLPGGGGVRAARATLDRAIEARGLFQLAIDAPEMAARGVSAEHVLERVLQFVQRRRQQGQLEITTIAATAAELAQRNQSQPSRSILRPAA